MSHERSESFAPIEGTTARWLFLGSMPGQASLKSGRYYAHPRNGFWPIIRYLIDGSKPSYEALDEKSYRQRCELAMQHGIAIWDVLASCERPGSLDGNIVKGSETGNDLHALHARHPELELIICNGKAAASLLEKLIVKKGSSLDSIRRTTVPSSSPAMASLSLLEKAQAWEVAINNPG